MSGDDELVAAARRWRDADPDPRTRAELDEVLARSDPQELRELFARPLAFGTAGVRGPLGPGPARMNRAVVGRLASALAAQLVEGRTSAGRPRVAVGRDARHGSAAFAQQAAEELAAGGVDVALLDGAVPTPLLARAVVDLGAEAGLMVTASHNPAGDNGVKVYGADGAQIVPPTDRDLARRMAAGPHDGPPAPHAGHGRVEAVDTSPTSPLVRAHLSAVRSLAGEGAAGGLRVVATALHGVGADLLDAALSVVGAEVVHVAHQREPDPDFPTSPRPNPEEPGVLDPLLELARERDADLAVALDPDADRLAVAVPDDGTWRVLTGDELGALLCAHLLERTDGTPDRLVASTVVSSQLCPAICAATGVRHVETLTGFKWLCRPALGDPRLRQVLLYEEALGYAIGPDARDKDGVVAAAVTAAMARGWLDRGTDARAVLDALAAAHGAHVQRNGTVPATPSAVAAALERFERLEVDLGAPVVRSDRPAPDVLRCWLADRTRVALRPSGTEPLLKYYCEAVEPVGRGPVRDARERAAARLEVAVAGLGALLDSTAAGLA